MTRSRKAKHQQKIENRKQVNLAKVNDAIDSILQQALADKQIEQWSLPVTESVVADPASNWHILYGLMHEKQEHTLFDWCQRRREYEKTKNIAEPNYQLLCVLFWLVQNQYLKDMLLPTTHTYIESLSKQPDCYGLTILDYQAWGEPNTALPTTKIIQQLRTTYDAETLSRVLTGRLKIADLPEQHQDLKTQYQLLLDNPTDAPTTDAVLFFVALAACIDKYDAEANNDFTSNYKNILAIYLQEIFLNPRHEQHIIASLFQHCSMIVSNIINEFDLGEVNLKLIEHLITCKPTTSCIEATKEIIFFAKTDRNSSINEEPLAWIWRNDNHASKSLFWQIFPETTKTNLSEKYPKPQI